MTCARFGHQDKITDIDVLSQERVVTSGARDGSVRIWKIVEESQLVFHGHGLVTHCLSSMDIGWSLSAGLCHVFGLVVKITLSLNKQK